jgi:DNA modification methylase
MSIKIVDIKTVKPNPSNPRHIKDHKFTQLVKSIRHFPEMLQLRPIVVDADNIVLGGNMRLKACIEAGLKEVPIIVASELTEEQQKEFIIKDNVGFGEWDWEQLANEWEIEQLSDWGLDLPIEMEDTEIEAVEDNYQAPDTIETDIVIGDLFEIGEHRLLCGDSTDSDAVAKLMNGEKAILMVTDPPYGVNYDATWRTDALGDKLMGKPREGLVSNDHRADWTDVWALFEGDIAYVWHASKFADVVMKSLRDVGFEITQQIIWNKSVMVLGRADYHFKHEPCWYAVRKGKNHNWQGNRKLTTVWDAAPPTHIMSGSKEEKTSHPTQKAAICMSIPIENNTKIGNGVYDPFLGSGTTMVAAHQLKRKCYGMELDPKYCQVIIDRMRKLDPDLKITRNGQPYESISKA